MTIQSILRGNYVRRFHANPDLAHVGDTNGHHQAMVAQIVFHIFPAASLDLIHAALHHDAAEQFVGDLPQPFKAAMPEFAAAHVKIESEMLDGMGASRMLTELEAAILKLADKMAAYLHVRHVAPHVLAGNGWPEDREKCIAVAWGIGAGVAAKVEGMLA